MFPFEASSKEQSGQSFTVMWFRKDLRLRDDSAHCAKSASGTVLSVVILDDKKFGELNMDNVFI